MPFLLPKYLAIILAPKNFLSPRNGTLENGMPFFGRQMNQPLVENVGFFCTYVSTKVWQMPEYVSKYPKKIVFCQDKVLFCLLCCVFGLARACEVVETVYKHTYEICQTLQEFTNVQLQCMLASASNVGIQDFRQFSKYR